MDFTFTKQQEMVRKVVSEFAKNEVAPGAAERDSTEEFPWDIVKKMADMGLMGIPYPEEYGGSGGDYISYIITVEEISKACAATGVILSAHTSLACYPLYQWGTEEQKSKYLVPLAQGKKLGAFALTEPNAGTDAASQQTTAVLDGDNYVLNGSKVFITNGGMADVYIVFAMTDRSKGARGISSFIVEKGFKGFSIGKIEKKMGIRASSTSELVFEDCLVPKENLLGKEGRGFSMAMETLDGGRIGIAAQALGIAEAALEEVIKYAKERQQFGRPIGKFQGIQWYIADMATRVQAARMLVYSAAWKKQTNKLTSADAAMAKLFASETAMYVTTKAVQIFGGYGYINDYPVERLMRDAKITEIYEGTSEVQKMVISGSLL
ncbi:acyl-CoA dehydrogenase [Calorimonas adulescens]|jgi:butyryl-CoA dehydrogenase (EC 1.3.99.2)|uniref:Acyl-CoA dehydrogenase n=1 Tax=Calorimonas adulescens TaxID=2606906 RepID=A0A5D8QEH4_9THEO|nr:acyl-CoA dehydrogenase [Calorimonas adulescens]TZE82807.1 acyl-CoA dehydrogenase [Calorimonas adulescens]